MKLKKSLLPAVVVAATQLARAQEITPVWFQHINGTQGVDPANKLPILVKPTAPEAADNQDGTETISAYAGLLRYNATKLLLEVRENGIDETNPNLTAAQKALAAQYPDHSLIWLDSATGKPLGLAFQENLNPPALLGIDVTADGSGSQGSNVNFWWRVALDDGADGQRYLYSSHKHIIYRYAPDGNGGWKPTPEIVYEEQVGGVGDGLSNGDGSKSWRWRDFHVHGSGTNTVIYAGGATWRAGQQPQVLVTSDGKNFHPVARVDNRDNGARRNDYALGGNSTYPVSLPNTYGADPNNPLISVVIAGHFPGTGWQARPNRYTLNPANPTPSAAYNQQPTVSNYERNESGHQGLPAFAWEAAGNNGAPIDTAVDGVTRYDGNWNAALAADGKLGYIVGYSMPSWNNQFGDIKKVGWVGVHRLDGSIASGNSSWKLDAIETDVASLGEAGDGSVGAANAYDGWVELNADPNAPANSGKAEALVAFGTYGFGVFTVQNVAATLVSSPGNQSVAAGSSVTLAATVTGSPNSYQWYHNGAPVPSLAAYLGTDHKAALTIPVVTAADAGTYQLKWTNPLSGAGQTATATLTVTGNATTLAGADIKPDTTTVAPAAGSTVATGPGAFTVSGGGLHAFANLGDTDQPGDVQQFASESVTGDFDKAVRLVSLTSTGSTNADNSAGAGLEVRTDTTASSANILLNASNPAGDNAVTVRGRAIARQNYTTFSRTFGGVANNIPNQWLRIRRAGNNFSFFVGTNGTAWTLIAEKYQIMPSTVLVGPYAFSATYDATAGTGGGNLAVAKFDNYGDVSNGDTSAPTLVSAGSTDGTIIGVKFSKVVDASSATLPLNYKVAGAHVTSVKLGIGGDTAYLTLDAKVTNTFTVTVLGGVADHAGNVIAANSTTTGKVANWGTTDIGYIQDPANRPTAGDDPYNVGQAVAVSSGDTETEIEVVGGGSNAWNPGDFLQYVASKTPISGDFDVEVEVSRDDRPANTAGWANSGLMLRASDYISGQEYTAAGTQVPMVANTTYIEASGPDRAAIPLWRTDVNGNYGNGNAGFQWDGNPINGIKGYFLGKNAVDAAGNVDPASSPLSSRWLRIKRAGDVFTFQASYDGKVWADVDSQTLTLPTQLLFGFSVMNDTGAVAPPNNAYSGNGHDDPTVTDPLMGNQNESNYSVLRIRIGTNVAPRVSVAPTVSIKNSGASVIITFTGTLQSSPSINGPFTPVAGAVSPLTLPSTAGSLFYRTAQ
jgi:Immunoglobulin I-set domain